MKINIFEGARRIAILLAGIWTVGWLIAAVVSWNPTVYTNYEVANFGSLPVRVVNRSCDTYDASTWAYPVSRGGRSTSASICFKAQSFGSVLLVPHRTDGTMVWGSDRYSNEVSRYTKIVAESFSIPANDEAWIESEFQSARWKQVKDGVMIVVIGLFFLWLATWTIGWVVRGFFGIPRGRDSKEPSRT